MAATLIVAVAAAILLSGVASTSGRVRVQRLASASFASAIDSRWTVAAHHAGGGYETFALSSTGARLDAAGIPPAGTIGITVAEGAAAPVEQRLRQAQAQQAAQPQGTRAGGRTAAAIGLLSDVVRTPAAAQGVELSNPPRFRTLAGANAAEESYEYLYGRRGNVQVDVVASRAGRIYFIELDTDLAHIGQGESALSRLLRNWRWR